MGNGTPRNAIPVVLLAAGLGSRLAPITDTVPKCLVPVNGKPLLGYWFDLLGAAGLGPFIVNTHHHADAVRRYVAGSPWRERVVLAHEETLRGTGGTLLANRLRLERGAFMVVHADNLSRFSVEAFLTAHAGRPAECIATMMLFRTPTPQSCGIVDLDSRGVVVGFHEKVDDPPRNLANAAVYVMEPEALGMLESFVGETPDLSRDFVPRCLRRMFTWLNDDYHRDIGTPESYAAALTEYRCNGE